MTSQLTESETAVTARGLRSRAVQVLARWLSEDLPEADWRMGRVSRFLSLIELGSADERLTPGESLEESSQQHSDGALRLRRSGEEGCRETSAPNTTDENEAGHAAAAA